MNRKESVPGKCVKGTSHSIVYVYAVLAGINVLIVRRMLVKTEFIYGMKETKHNFRRGRFVGKGLFTTDDAGAPVSFPAPKVVMDMGVVHVPQTPPTSPRIRLPQSWPYSGVHTESYRRRHVMPPQPWHDLYNNMQKSST
jgi:hypothetical protein